MLRLYYAIGAIAFHRPGFLFSYCTVFYWALGGAFRLKILGNLSCVLRTTNTVLSVYCIIPRGTDVLCSNSIPGLKRVQKSGSPVSLGLRQGEPKIHFSVIHPRKAPPSGGVPCPPFLHPERPLIIYLITEEQRSSKYERFLIHA
jgi:hypothetical protein